MKKLLIVVIVIIVCLSASNSLAKRYIIEGYESYQWSISGVPAKQFQSTVEDMKKTQGKQVGSWEIKIEGCADKTGTNKENEPIAKNRKDEAAEYLKSEFKGIEPVAFSTGTENNKRCVIIEAVFVPKTLTEPANFHVDNDTKVWLQTAAATILLFFTGFLVCRRKKVENSHQKNTESTSVKPAMSLKTEDEFWVICQYRATQKQVRIWAQKDEGIEYWYTPFLTDNKKGLIRRADKKAAMKEVLNRMKKPQYFPEIDKFAQENFRDWTGIEK